MKKPHIGILYEETLSTKIFDSLIETISVNSLDLKIQSVESGPQAMALEWLLPTAIITYISKPYFDTFLKEMGKDHYNLLKKGLLSLQENLFGDNAPRITIITSEGAENKVKDGSYSLLFSIIADTKDNRHFKLLIQDDISAKEYKQTIDLFLIFLDKYHSDSLDNETYLDVTNQKDIHGTIFIAYSRDKDKLEFLNVFER